MHSFMEGLARKLAITGGLVLTALVVLVCVSVAGRGANTFGHWDGLETAAPGVASWLVGTGIGPVSGDFEIVEAGIAFAIFSFLPLCQLRSGHATVDVFTMNLPVRVNTWLIAFWELVLSAVILLITWRLFAGMLGKISNGETTFILQFPIWWAYVASFLAACIASLVALYCAFVSVVTLTTGQQVAPSGEGASH